MNLIRTAAAAFRIHIATLINRIIYYFKRIPLLGRLAPDTLYGSAGLKSAGLGIGILLEVLGMFVWKALYVIVMCVLPFLFQDPSIKFSLFVNAVFFLSFLFGSLNAMSMLRNSMEKYLCVRLCRLPAREYMCGLFLKRHLTDLIGFVPALIAGALLTGGNGWYGLLLAVMLVAVQSGAEALELAFFRRSGIVAEQKVALVLPMMLLSLAGAYLPLLTERDFGVANVLFHPVTVLICLAVGTVGVFYILRFPKFVQVASATSRPENLVKAKGAMAEAKFSDVKLKQKDLEKTDTKKFEKLSGYRYLNAIFFERHKRLLLKPFFLESALLLAVIAAGVIAIVLVPDTGKAVAERIPQLLPACVFLMYWLTSNSERICRAMFNNCDKAMLRYRFYRQPEIILSNFFIRLRWMIRPNLALGVLVAGGLIGCALLAGVQWPIGDMLLFAVSILLLGVFFSVHNLFLYYVLQPYSSELGLRSPLYQVIQTGIYVVCFICLKLDATPSYFSVLVLGATAVYTLVALVLVRRLGPEKFRIK